MDMIAQNPYYLVSLIAGIAAVGFIVAAIVFLVKERTGKKGTEQKSRKDTDKMVKEKKFVFRRKKKEEAAELDEPQKTFLHPAANRRLRVGVGAASELDCEAYKQSIIEDYQQCTGLKDTIWLLQETWQGGWQENIDRAKQYLTQSRYKDVETALDYLLEGMEA